jgi:hypothetical protein
MIMCPFAFYMDFVQKYVSCFFFFLKELHIFYTREKQRVRAPKEGCKKKKEKQGIRRPNKGAK